MREGTETGEATEMQDDIDTRDGSALDRALEALADEYRRRLLSRLHDATPTVGVAVEEVDPGEPPEDVHHVHLPKLEAREYVETTHDSRLAYRGERFGEVASVMAVLEANTSELPGHWP